jgi:uncharacterized protein YcgI (DUF1989 family)
MEENFAIPIKTHDTFLNACATRVDYTNYGAADLHGMIHCLGYFLARHFAK